MLRAQGVGRNAGIQQETGRGGAGSEWESGGVYKNARVHAAEFIKMYKNKIFLFFLKKN